MTLPAILWTTPPDAKRRWTQLLQDMEDWAGHGGSAATKQTIFMSHSSADHVWWNLAIHGSVRSVLLQHKPELVAIDSNLNRVRGEAMDVLTKAGLPPQATDALMRYLDITLKTNLAVRDIVAEEASALLARRDPTEGLSAVELAKKLGVTDETVRNREAAGELFSVLRPGRKRGREYPAFQTWEGIAGEPLTQVLAALGRPPGPTAYAFFTAADDTLGGISPIEALLGFCRDPAAPPEIGEFLALPASERLAAVVSAARTFAALLAA